MVLTEMNRLSYEEPVATFTMDSYSMMTTRGPRSVHDEFVSAMEDDVVAIAHIERHERLATIKSLGQSWENISKLEHGVVGRLCFAARLAFPGLRLRAIC
jgi:hypothetical protein